MPTNKPILAFDCATSGASIALSAGGRTYTRDLSQGKQAAALVSAIDALMQEATTSYADLGAIVTTTGPGSFTGLRIGLATLHGLVLVNRTPLKTLTTLEAMAWHLAPTAPSPFTVAIRAGKGELCAQEFDVQNSTPKAMGEVYLVPEAHTGWPAPCYGNHLPPEDAHYLAGPNSVTLCAIAEQLTESSLAEALPFYIRPPDALIPAQPAWLS